MNKHLDPVLLRAVAVDVESYLDSIGSPVKLPRPHPGAAFNKRPEGYARRVARRNVRSAKSLWLNS